MSTATKRPSPLDRFAQAIPPGRLDWIGLRPGRRQPMTPTDRAEAIAELGLDGDHRTRKTPGSGRQVTVISREFIAQIGHFLGRDAVDPALLRRNLVVEGINLNALRHQRFFIGEVLLEAGALCHPCARMEEALGPGAVVAMLGHGGLCCRVLSGGTLQVGATVRVAPRDEASPNR